MNQDENKLRAALESKFKAPIQCEIATVVSVDEDALTCEVELADGTEIPDVRLKASVQEDMHDGLVQIPEAGSSVVVGLIGNDLGTRFVMLFSTVTKVVMYGGENGPLVVWTPETGTGLKAELDKVKNMLNNMKTIIGGSPIPEPGNGSPSAFQAALAAAIAADQIPSFEDLTDDKVLH